MKNETTLKKVFKKSGLSYRQASKIFGVTHQHISQVVNGKHTSRPLALKIFRHAGVEYEFPARPTKKQYLKNASKYYDRLKKQGKEKCAQAIEEIASQI